MSGDAGGIRSIVGFGVINPGCTGSFSGASGGMSLSGVHVIGSAGTVGLAWWGGSAVTFVG